MQSSPASRGQQHRERQAATYPVREILPSTPWTQARPDGGPGNVSPAHHAPGSQTPEAPRDKII